MESKDEPELEAPEPRVERLPTEEIPIIEADANETVVIAEDEQAETTEATGPHKHHRTPIHRLDLSDDEHPELTIDWCERVPMTRFKHYWLCHTRTLSLDLTSLVDLRYAAKTGFVPSESETEIKYLQRLHWLSHVPQEIGVLLIWLLGIAAGSWALSITELAAWQGWLIIGMLLWSAAWAFAAWLEWFHWNYTHLICTDQRLIRIYLPPWKLPPKIEASALNKLQDITTHSSWVANFFDCGTIKTETASSQQDQWLRDGIHYIPSYQRLHALLTQ